MGNGEPSLAPFLTTAFRPPFRTKTLALGYDDLNRAIEALETSEQMPKPQGTAAAAVAEAAGEAVGGGHGGPALARTPPSPPAGY